MQRIQNVSTSTAAWRTARRSGSNRPSEFRGRRTPAEGCRSVRRWRRDAKSEPVTLASPRHRAVTSGTVLPQTRTSTSCCVRRPHLHWHSPTPATPASTPTLSSPENMLVYFCNFLIRPPGVRSRSRSPIFKYKKIQKNAKISHVFLTLATPARP